MAADNLQILGVAWQKTHYRQARPKKETAAQRLKRERESKVWGELIDGVSRPANLVRYAQVCDRGADGYEGFCYLVKQQVDWVVRTERYDTTSDGNLIARGETL